MLLIALLCAQGCADSTVRFYGPLTRELDGKSELHISTYPSGFPGETFGIPYLYRKMYTPDTVYFELFVRDAEKKFGKNPHVESITIHSFSYWFPGQAPVELLSNYHDNFWQQGSPKYNPEGSEPVRWDDAWYMQVRVELTLNGEDYVIEDRIDGDTRRRIYPLILRALQ